MCPGSHQCCLAARSAVVHQPPRSSQFDRAYPPTTERATRLERLDMSGTNPYDVGSGTRLALTPVDGRAAGRRLPGRRDAAARGALARPVHPSSPARSPGRRRGMEHALPAGERDRRRRVLPAARRGPGGRAGAGVRDRAGARRRAPLPRHGHQHGPGRVRRRGAGDRAPTARRPRRGARPDRPPRARAHSSAARDHRRPLAAGGPWRAARAWTRRPWWWPARRGFSTTHGHVSACTWGGAGARCCGSSAPRPRAPRSAAASCCCRARYACRPGRRTPRPGCTSRRRTPVSTVWPRSGTATNGRWPRIRTCSRSC